jgi:transcriptional regulator with XRE-family HTH domain
MSGSMRLPWRSPRPHGGVQLEPSAELHSLMLSWRERLDPLSIPGLEAESRRRKTVSQDLMARLVGVSAPWYGKLERGEREPNYSDDFLERVAYSLRLDDDERTILFLLAVGREPTPRVRPASGVVGEMLERIVHRQPWPAYISDRAWDVVVYNQAMADWFPHFAYELNVMRWVFYYPASRLQLVEWETSWAPLMLAQMRLAHAKWPKDKRLTGLIRETLTENEFARNLWRTKPKVYVHPDGDRRRLHLPFEDAVREIEIVAMNPMRAPDMRLIMLMAVDGSEPSP